MIASRLTLKDFFHSVYLKHHIWIKSNTIVQYDVTLRLLDGWHGQQQPAQPVAVEDLCTDLVLDFLRFRFSMSAARTVNNNRSSILTLWRFAHRHGYTETPVPDSRDILKLPETRRLPEAWSIQEMSAILSATATARTLPGWDARHWRALILVSYDTGHRLSSLLSAKKEDLSALGFLIVRETKQKRETVHKLHADTIAAIDALPEHRLLFPWRLSIKSIHPEYKKILKAADPPLPCGRRDLFQRLRRTSATHLAAVAGIEAAEQHLDHTTHGLAVKSYIDQRYMPTVNASDIMPRP